MVDTNSALEVRSNTRWGYLNRTFAEIGKALADPTIVFSLFVRQLGASNTLVGLLSTIRYGGWFFPQLFVADRIQHRARRGRFYIIAELPSHTAAAAVAATIGASGAVAAFETVALLTGEELDGAVKLSPIYRPPGR